MQTKNDIKLLLKKYEDGISSLAEEKYLRSYFQNTNFDGEFAEYYELFGIYKNEKEKQYHDFKFEPKSTRLIRFSLPLKIATAAALIAILVSISWFLQPSQTYNNPTKEELMLASKHLENSMKIFNKAFSSSSTLLSQVSRMETETSELQKVGEIYNRQMKRLEKVNYLDNGFHHLQHITKMKKSRIKVIM